MTKVAVIGAGPRAGQALERLATLGERHHISLPEVDVIAPGRGLGAGEIYSEGQPDWLRLNVASSLVQAWSEPRADQSRISFDGWREAYVPASATDQFPPRSLAGQYLSAVGARVRAEVPGTRCPGRVTGVLATEKGWRIALDDGQQYGGYSEVLLATGHAHDWNGALRHQLPAEHRLVSHVFPVTELMNRVSDLRPGAVVVIRGAALTGLDAALTVVAAARSGVRIVLASRTGRLMMPKTESRVLEQVPALEELTSLARTRVLSGDGVPPILAEIAVGLLSGKTGFARVQAAIREVFSRQPPRDPSGWLRRQLDIAEGKDDPDATWALAQAWRLCYPALVERQGSRSPGDAPLGWAQYGAWSAELERVGFGPPPVNGRALLELLESGIVQVVGTDDVRGLVQWEQAALVVDAVLPPPGLRGIRDPLLDQLVHAGLIEGSPHGRGVLVDYDATSIVGRERTRGLAVVGRLTEDVVIGNDTLIRSLHPQIDRWAHRVLGLAWPAEDPPRD